MHGDHRGRLTVPDVVFVLAAIAVIGALSPVFYDALRSNTSEMSTGTLYLLQLIIPFAIAVLFSVIYMKATAGVGN